MSQEQTENLVVTKITLEVFSSAPLSLIKTRTEEAMNLACTFLEEELKHTAIRYHLEQE